ncbi:MAG: radical SAM protein [Bacteroidales bacterium]|nr:radical SAM protein [Bacteroidales bacterium]
MSEKKAYFIGIERHRIDRDGEGVTTLVAFWGCPLKCQYCLNPQCNRIEDKTLLLSPQELYNRVAIDNLYFLATNGGITFGGGEPCLNSAFIEQFYNLTNKNWAINFETSLNVDFSHIERLLPFANQFIIDIKDINSDIYLAYTKISNLQVLNNLKKLADLKLQSKCIIRIPKIPDFNTQNDINYSIKYLKNLGFNKFDIFEYIKEINK